jgi:hypothetical protein
MAIGRLSGHKKIDLGRAANLRLDIFVDAYQQRGGAVYMYWKQGMYKRKGFYYKQELRKFILDVENGKINRKEALDQCPVEMLRTSWRFSMFNSGYVLNSVDKKRLEEYFRR